MRICFIVAPQNKGTILDRIAHEIGRGFDEPIYHYDTVGIPKANHYFITHYSLLPMIIAQINPGITPVTAFFTHDKGGSVPARNYVNEFNLCHSVIAENPEGVEVLKSIGVDERLLHWVAEGGDNEIFKPHARTQDGAILVCGTNYADGRKNPELVKQVVKSLPNRKFKFIGQSWIGMEVGNNNVDVADCCDYELYPVEYGRCSVYLSCSKLEGGGPNSLIEAMHANLVPVVSDTGNAREYIIDGYNGFIFGKDAAPEQVAELIEEAYKLNPQNHVPYNDVWQTVRDYTWKGYALQMKEIIMGNYSITASQGEFGQLPSDEPFDPHSESDN